MTTPNIPQVPLTEVQFFTTEQVMKLLRYRCRKRFGEAIRANGIPFIRVSSRRFLFEEAAIRAWLESRQIGGKDGAN